MTKGAGPNIVCIVLQSDFILHSGCFHSRWGQRSPSDCVSVSGSSVQYPAVCVCERVCESVCEWVWVCSCVSVCVCVCVLQPEDLRFNPPAVPALVDVSLSKTLNLSVSLCHETSSPPSELTVGPGQEEHSRRFSSRSEPVPLSSWITQITETGAPSAINQRAAVVIGHVRVGLLSSRCDRFYDIQITRMIMCWVSTIEGKTVIWWSCELRFDCLACA